MRESRLSSRAFWGLASWALPLAIVFVVSPRLLHLLGADQFGVLMIALLTPLIAVQLDFGVVSVAVRRIAAVPAGGPIDARGLLLTFFLALSLIGVALGTLLWFGSDRIAAAVGMTEVLGPGEGARLIKLCAVWAVISLATLLPGVIARTLQRLLLLAAMQTLSTALLWGAAWYLVFVGADIASVVLMGIALSMFVSALTLAMLRARIGWRGTLRAPPALLLADWRFALGMFAAQVASAIVYQGDRLLISALGSPAIAGLYTLCTSLANKTSAAVSALTSFVFPHAAALHAESRHERLGGLLHALDRAVAVLVIPIMLPALALASPFLELWLGSYATDELAFAFRILLVAFAIPAFAVPVHNILIGTGQSGLPARFAWLTVLVILAALVALVPAYGLVGAAFAMALANSTSLVFSFVARRALKFGRAGGALRFWAGIALGCAAQLVVLYHLVHHATSWPALFAIGGGAWAVFYAARAIVGALGPEEMEFFRRFRGRLSGRELG